MIVHRLHNTFFKDYLTSYVDSKRLMWKNYDFAGVSQLEGLLAYVYITTFMVVYKHTCIQMYMIIHG